MYAAEYPAGWGAAVVTCFLEPIWREAAHSSCSAPSRTHTRPCIVALASSVPLWLCGLWCLYVHAIWCWWLLAERG
jgi:hypothetical protein